MNSVCAAAGGATRDVSAARMAWRQKAGGDDTRRYAEPQVRGESAASMMVNRNKRAMAVDLKKEGRVRVLRRLA